MLGLGVLNLKYVMISQCIRKMVLKGDRLSAYISKDIL